MKREEFLEKYKYRHVDGQKSEIYPRDIFRFLEAPPWPAGFKGWSLKWTLALRIEGNIDREIWIIECRKENSERWFWARESRGHDDGPDYQSLFEHRVKQYWVNPWGLPWGDMINGRTTKEEREYIEDLRSAP